MKIPTNSNFSRELQKKLQRIINPQTTLEELQNLQDEMKMINPVDTHLLNQVSQLKEMDMNNPKKMFRMQEQYDKSILKKKVLLEQLLKVEQKSKKLAWKLHQIKYHQVTL